MEQLKLWKIETDNETKFRSVNNITLDKAVVVAFPGGHSFNEADPVGKYNSIRWLEPIFKNDETTNRYNFYIITRKEARKYEDSWSRNLSANFNASPHSYTESYIPELTENLFGEILNDKTPNYKEAIMLAGRFTLIGASDGATQIQTMLTELQSGLAAIYSADEVNNILGKIIAINLLPACDVIDMSVAKNADFNQAYFFTENDEVVREQTSNHKLFDGDRSEIIGHKAIGRKIVIATKIKNCLLF